VKYKKEIFNITLIAWGIATLYLLYKYSLQAGYWEHPLYTSLILYIALVIINKGFNKLIASLFLVYIGLGVWFIMDFLMLFSDVLGG
jgi:hypothetical protein